METRFAVVASALMFALPGGPVVHVEDAEASSFPGANGKVVFDLACVDDTECDESENGIYEVTDEGIARLTSDPGDRSPAWSYDGDWLAFSRCDDTDCDIWIARADGSEERAITDTPSLNEWEPSWEPANDAIVFRECPVDSGPNSCELRTVDTSSGATETITDNERLEQDPAWAPNGKRIVFEAGKCQDNVAGAPHCTYKKPPQIYKLDRGWDGKAEKITSLDRGARDPNYSPAGSASCSTTTAGVSSRSRREGPGYGSSDSRTRMGSTTRITRRMRGS